MKLLRVLLVEAEFNGKVRQVEFTDKGMIVAGVTFEDIFGQASSLPVPTAQVTQVEAPRVPGGIPTKEDLKVAGAKEYSDVGDVACSSDGLKASGSVCKVCNEAQFSTASDPEPDCKYMHAREANAYKPAKKKPSPVLAKVEPVAEAPAPVSGDVPPELLASKNLKEVVNHLIDRGATTAPKLIADCIKYQPHVKVLAGYGESLPKAVQSMAAMWLKDTAA